MSKIRISHALALYNTLSKCRSNELDKDLQNKIVDNFLVLYPIVKEFEDTRDALLAQHLEESVYTERINKILNEEREFNFTYVTFDEVMNNIAPATNDWSLGLIGVLDAIIKEDKK